MVDSDIQAIAAGGAQIFGLHTTAAPKRKSQNKPILENYAFVPNHSVVSAATPEFQDYLDCCSFVSYSSLKNVGDNAKALRLPAKFLEDLARLARKSGNADSILGLFEDDEKHALLSYMKRLSQDANCSPDFNMKDDLLLSNIFSLPNLKPALDIVMENSGTCRLKMAEVEPHEYHIYRTVLASYATQPVVQIDYTACGGDNFQPESDEVKVSKREDLSNQHLVIGSHVMSEAGNLAMLKEITRQGGFLLTLEYNYELENYERKMNKEGYEIVYSVRNPIQTIFLSKLKPENGELTCSFSSVSQ